MLAVKEKPIDRFSHFLNCTKKYTIKIYETQKREKH